MGVAGRVQLQLEQVPQISQRKVFLKRRTKVKVKKNHKNQNGFRQTDARANGNNGTQALLLEDRYNTQEVSSMIVVIFRAIKTVVETSQAAFLFTKITGYINVWPATLFQD